MAGIGFRLQKLLTGESYLDLVKAYLYSSVIATGPLIVVMTNLLGIKAAAQVRLSLEEGQLFMGLIIYAYAFSIILTGPILYVITRYLADKHYLGDTDAFTPTYFSVLEILFAGQLIIAVWFLDHVPISAPAKWALCGLYLAVNGIWIAMSFLSAARDYLWIFWGFVGGAAAGIAATLVWGKSQGFDGFVKGYAFGQVLTFLILTGRILREFGYVRTHRFEFLGYFRKFPYLMMTGLFYSLALWVDKAVFWLSPEAEKLGGPIRVYTSYDVPMFLAFLSVIPSMSFFLVQMETSFALRYRAYYESVRRRESLHSIERKKNGIVADLTEHFAKYALFQGLISGFLILFIYEIAEALSLNPLQMGIMRIGVLGAYLQTAFMMMLVILFYFDFQRETTFLSVFFFAANWFFSALTLRVGYPSYGFGFTAAAFLSVIAGFLILDHRLRRLEYFTFMRQPVLIPKFKLENETK